MIFCQRLSPPEHQPLLSNRTTASGRSPQHSASHKCKPKEGMNPTSHFMFSMSHPYIPRLVSPYPPPIYPPAFRRARSPVRAGSSPEGVWGDVRGWGTRRGSRPPPPSLFPAADGRCGASSRSAPRRRGAVPCPLRRPAGVTLHPATEGGMPLPTGEKKPHVY